MGIAKSRWLFGLICIAVFASGLTMTFHSYANMVVVLAYELFVIAICFLSLDANEKILNFIRQRLFIFSLSSILVIILLNYSEFRFPLNAYILLILFAVLTRDLSPYFKRLTNNKLLTGLFVLWLISVSFSYYSSPIGVVEFYASQIRFEQSIVHIICLFCLMVFLQDHNLPISYLILTIPAAVLIVGFSFLYLYAVSSIEIGPREWFFRPPWNSHIRHLGFQVTAGLAILLAYFAVGKPQNPSTRRMILGYIHFIATVLVWAFLFWCGGRSSIASIGVLATLIVLVLWPDKAKMRYFVLVGLASSVSGLVLSMWLTVFPWNGLFQGIERVVSVDTIGQLTTGRSELWRIAWDAMDEHWLFGLGADSYFYIPEVNKSVSHPHNLFVQFLIEWGLIGGVLFISMLVIVTFQGVKSIGRVGVFQVPVYILAAGAVIISLTLHALTAGVYFMAQSGFILIVAFAVWLSRGVGDVR